MNDIFIAKSDNQIKKIINKLETKYTIQHLVELNNNFERKTYNRFKLNPAAKIAEIIKKKFSLEN